MTSVLIIVLNWNGIDDTEKCINSLLQQTYENYKVLIVENGSKDDSLKRIKDLCLKNPDAVSYVANTRNLGFAGGVNVGIKFAIDNGFDAVALFNNDAVADKNWLKNLAAHLSEQHAVVTGLLLHADGKTIDSTGDFYSTWGIGFPRNRGDSKSKAPKSGVVFSGSGGGSLYSTSLFKKIGLFDESFFAYYEDTDISFRAQLAGNKVFYANNAIAYHEQGATSSKIPGFTVYQTFKNLPLLFWKNVPTKILPSVGARFALLYSLIFVNSLKKGSGWPAFRGLLASIYYFWTSALWKRLEIQHRKKVSADYIWSILYHDLPPEQTGMRKFRKLFTGKD
ncbi:MAG: glycosyltransferase family 2 protein [Candidatus Saccharimonadota bacterium]